MISKRYCGHFSRKRFGQHFLSDHHIIDSIVAAIGPRKDHAMVEIGPGLNALTDPIGKYLDQLVVIEIDHNLVTYLQKYSSIRSKLMIYQQDVMTINFYELSQRLGKPLRIFGNLPYNISTSLICYLFKYIDVIVDMHFMLQEEVANRLIATPNTKVYGHLSVITQYYYQMIKILEVPPSAFIPSPTVNSAMIRFTRHYPMPYFVYDINVLHLVTMTAFNHRRKIIKNSLNKLFTVDNLIKLGISPTIRAENISVDQYCLMANYISGFK